MEAQKPDFSDFFKVGDAIPAKNHDEDEEQLRGSGREGWGGLNRSGGEGGAKRPPHIHRTTVWTRCGCGCVCVQKQQR